MSSEKNSSNSEISATGKALREEDRSKTTKLYQMFIESISLPMLFINKHGKIKLANQASKEIFGYDATELVGKELPVLIQDGMEVFRHKTNEDDLQKNQAVRSTAVETIGFRKNGETVALEVLPGEFVCEGRVYHTLLVRDISQYKQTASELRASQELYHDLVENANDIIYSHDMKGRITSVNAAGMRLMQLERDEILSTNIYNIMTSESIERAKEMFDKKLSGEEKTVYEVDIFTKANRRATLEISTKIIYQNEEPAGVQGIARDVTERKMLQTQLHQAQKMEMIGQLAGGIAHDFNNLLTVILGKTDLALMQLRNSPGQLHDDLMEVKKTAERAANLTQQILAFSRKQVLQTRIINPNSTIAGMSKILERLIGEDVNLEVKLSPTLGTVKADPGQIEQIVMNLAVNSRDAMPLGGKLTIETSNVILDEVYARQHLNARAGHYIMIAVSDNGAGMSNEVLKHIFEPFFTTKEAGKGTGLGLATVYGIVKQSGGYIWAYSEENIGTTFKIYLPRVDGPAKTSLSEQIQANVFQGHETILLVEDDNAIRELVKEMLETVGYKVIDASNGVKALSLAQTASESIDLLMTDVVMPDMRGNKLVEHVKTLKSDMKVLYMTGYSYEAVFRHKILEDGSSFIQKPFTFESLTFAVRKLLDDSITSN